MLAVPTNRSYVTYNNKSVTNYCVHTKKSHLGQTTQL